MRVYQTYIESGSVKHKLFTFETEAEALEFCEENRWCWFDENEFEWSLSIEEEEQDVYFPALDDDYDDYGYDDYEYDDDEYF